MTVQHRSQDATSNCADPALTAAEFRKLIFKLRWIGADDQADKVVKYLIKTAPPGFVCLQIGDTD